MTLPAPFIRRIHWLNLPAALLLTLLQRTPVLRVLVGGGEYVLQSSGGQVLRAAMTVATLGAMHSRAGATEFIGPSVVNGVVGTPLQVGFTYIGTPSSPGRFEFTGSLPPGLQFIPAPNGNSIPSGTPVIAGTPTVGGSFSITVQGFNPEGLTNSVQQPIEFVITGGSSGPPSISSQPSNQSTSAGGSVSLSVGAGGATGFQWQRNGVAVAGGTSATLVVSNLQPASTGLYAAVATGSAGSTTSSPAIVGLSGSAKLVGPGTEFPDIFHAGTGFTYDQILLEGGAATVKPDSGQILRISYIDINDDIVQVEMSGSGTLSLVLAGVSGPAAPVNYNQGVTYMKGHVGIVVTGATETTNLSVFSVGRANAANQALFKDTVTYDGFADIAFIAITSADGRFGGLRAANAHMFESQGFTGLFAPNVQFTGPVFIGNITTTSSSTATPLFIIGSGPDVRVTGGDLFQGNGRAVQVKGISQLRFTAGSNSHGTITAAQTNKGVLEQDGANVTSQIVVP